ncbi:MAG: diguanylate cyclase [Acidobacteria bacterium]|nr:diguanylate cyclase [Acidobacteriota bacterium]
MNILVVEDDPSAAALVQRILKRLGHESDIATDAAAAWRIIQDGRHRIVVSDWMMPGEDGLSMCRRIRASSLPFYVYVVILTGRSQRGDLLEALSAGADDFLVKPVDPDELRVRLLVAERIVGLEARLRAANDALQQYARDLDERAKIDELMQIGNRAAFEARLRELHAWALKSGRGFAVVMCDVDRFKSYNDRLGHQRGDQILREIAKAVTQGVRATDLAFRYGGEEIVLLLPDLDTASAANVAERVRAQVRAIRFELEGAGAPFHATISCGVAAYPLHARGADDARGAVEWADHALYEAKRLGRDRVERADRLATAPDGAHSCGASDHGGKEPRAASTLPPIQ